MRAQSAGRIRANGATIADIWLKVTHDSWQSLDNQREKRVVCKTVRHLPLYTLFPHFVACSLGTALCSVVSFAERSLAAALDRYDTYPDHHPSQQRPLQPPQQRPNLTDDLPPHPLL